MGGARSIRRKQHQLGRELRGEDEVEDLKDCTVVFSNKKIFVIVTSFVWHTKKFSQLGLTKALLDTYLVHKY